ncbi:MAG: isoprenylcysteine carboxylmethyltransferase family protein [Bacteroidales bacterium]|jgi:protein-S-isoprenylcysteine O-methyltransferase Ste14|nr:isoprenylcysteine carboxylmethyltransferase family protein [Bacteroidales bacterium]
MQITKKILFVALRLGFGICLFLSQFTGNRNTFFTDNPYMLCLGILVFLAGILFWVTSSYNLQKAVKENRIAASGPYKFVRHPIYTSIYILTAGLGFMFFAWFWFVIMIVFIPLWYLECRKEEKEMIELHGEEYINYRKNTGMFFLKTER